MRSLRSAVEFLTVLPLRRTDAPPADRLGRALFPAIGALVGLVAGVVFVLVSAFMPRLVAGAAAVTSAAVLTGGLHLDGLADAADGLLGGGSVERRLEIMRDPRLGSFGAIALILVVVAEIALLSAMSPFRGLEGLVVAGALSRLAVLAMIVFVPSVRNDGLGVAVTGGRRGFDLVIGSACPLIVSLLDVRRAFIALVLVALTTLLVTGVARRRIGGATGDVYGACSELGQLAALVAFAVQ